ncbi:MAG: DUF6266 family protein [Breznakibacter sp.]
MGKYSDGILGHFFGKVGTVVGSKWKGIHYMRSKGSPRTGGFSDKQMEQQARFAAATRFIQPLHPVLRIGFHTQTRDNTALNLALSDLLLRAMAGDYPDFVINYPALRLAKGTLLPVYQPQVSIEDGQIRFDWDVQNDQAGASADDEAMVVAIAEEGSVSYLLRGATRVARSALLAIPQGAAGAPVHCYMAMVSATGKEVSNSLYVGTVQING